MTIIQSNSNIIESINPRTLSKKDLEKIVEIEQDMWAREDGLGEYIKCECCNKIYSKEDIFGHLSKEIKIKTIKKIEKIIDFDIVCPYCKSKVKSIYDREEYIESVLDRYKNTIESFLTVYRDENGEIRGFFDGYIDTFENIYEREFNNYYSHIGKNNLESIIKNKLGYPIPNNIFIFSSVGIEKKYINFIVYLKLLKSLFFSISDTKNDYIGITDVKDETNISKLYQLLGSKKLNLNNFDDLKGKILNKNNKVSTDLYIHEKVVYDYKKEFNLTIKEFLIKYKTSLKVA